MSATEKARVLAADQAAQWLVRLQDPAATVAERAEFAAWLRFSPAHVHEFLNARATWEALSGEGLRQMPDQDALLRMLGASEPVATVVTLGEQRKPSSPAAGRTPVRRRLLAVAAGMAALAIGGATYWTLQSGDPDRSLYTTAIGQQSSHTLSDGSAFVLNTNSSLRLDWSAQYRDVYLDRGEAVFEVAHDKARPFRVWSGKTMVRAVGTRFNVYRTADAVRVTVLEGRVEVTSGNAGMQPVSIGAGEQAEVVKQAAVQTQQLEQPEKAVAWQMRRLEFEGTPLAQVIAEFNRYHPTPLVLEDPLLANKRIDGAFDSADRDSLVAFLEQFEDVQIEKRDRMTLIRSR